MRRRAAAALLLAGLSIAPVAQARTAYRWESWRHLAGVFDVDGPRRDGAMVVADPAGLKLLRGDGSLVPFAPAYHLGNASEAYVAVAPATGATTRGCAFAPDDVYALKLDPPLGVTRISAAGDVSAFATIPGTESLGGIAFDSTGRFGGRLLVMGPRQGKTVVAAVDCHGTVDVLTSSAPRAEGGIAVAPAGFGAFGGELVAPDEQSDTIWAIAPDGTSRVVTMPGLDKGGDIGVESLGFVPQGWSSGGFAYVADRGTPGNPHPGTDTILRLASATLAALPGTVRDGDLVVATEGAATTVVVRCAAACTSAIVATGDPSSHGEGHVAFSVDSAGRAATPGALVPVPPGRSSTPLWFEAGALAVVAAAVVGLLASRLRRRASRA